jgi:hypothetical protein
MAEINSGIEHGEEPPQEVVPPSQEGASVKAIIENTPGAEQAPSWFKETVKTVTDAWFDPKSFEENPEVYEKLGIKTFKKYLPTTGDLTMRLVRKRFSDAGFIKSASVEALKDYEKFTRVYEGIHTTFLGVGGAIMADQLAEGRIGAAAFTAGINTLVNVYPIMLQRYNRSRLYRTIHRVEERDARRNQQPPETNA